MSESNAGTARTFLHLFTSAVEQSMPDVAQRMGPDPMWPKGKSDRTMPRELYLQRTARECLANGRLPRIRSECIWGGYGQGDTCSLCGEPIRSTEVEFEIPEPAEGTWQAAPGTTFRFHITCHAVWQSECADEEQAAGTPA